MLKGSPEAIAFGKKMKALRDGKNKISRPVEKGKPEPAEVSGGSGAGAGSKRKKTPSPKTPPPTQRQRTEPPPTQRQRTEPPPIQRQRRQPIPLSMEQPSTPPRRQIRLPDTTPIYRYNPNISEDENADEEVAYYMSGGRIPAPPSRMYGGKIPAPPSRSYDTASEDAIDGIMINGGALNDCPTCCGMGIVKIKGKGTGSSKIKPTEEKQYDYLKYKNDPSKFHKRTNKLLRDNELFMSCLNKMNTGKINEITPEEIKAYNTS
jgi:hypothetical protein